MKFTNINSTMNQKHTFNEQSVVVCMLACKLIHRKYGCEGGKGRETRVLQYYTCTCTHKYIQYVYYVIDMQKLQESTVLS